MVRAGATLLSLAGAIIVLGACGSGAVTVYKTAPASTRTPSAAKAAAPKVTKTDVGAELEAATRAEPSGGAGGHHLGEVRVIGGWARATLSGVQPMELLFHKSGARWRVVTFGSYIHDVPGIPATTAQAFGIRVVTPETVERVKSERETEERIGQVEKRQEAQEQALQAEREAAARAQREEECLAKVGVRGC